MQFSAAQPPAGWYPDPAGSGDERYWDGAAWSQVTRPGARDAGQPATQPGRPELAGWWQRLAAYVLDLVLVAFPLWLLIFSFMPESLSQNLVEWGDQWQLQMQAGSSTFMPEIPADVRGALYLALGVLLALGLAYRTVMVATRGATLGTMLMRIRVARADDPAGKPPGMLRAALRAVMEMVLPVLPSLLAFLFLINYLLPLFQPRRQTLHDAAARTIVIKN